MVTSLRLTSGLKMLEQWSVHACQADRNAIYQALFSVVEGSVFMVYDVLDDGRPRQFCMLLKEGLTARIRLHRYDSFGIIYIGPYEAGDPGLAPEESGDET